MFNNIIAHAEQIKPPGPFTGEDTDNAINSIVQGIFTLLFVIAGFYALIQIIIAGYGLIAGGGDPKALATARGKIIWAVVGLLVIAISWGLMVLVQNMLGVCLGLGCS